jgi:hypothetical protein
MHESFLYFIGSTIRLGIYAECERHLFIARMASMRYSICISAEAVTPLETEHCQCHSGKTILAFVLAYVF